jgi:CelD/BcsL family acetyltransferase involved in cellulose biosynthesis
VIELSPNACLACSSNGCVARDIRLLVAKSCRLRSPKLSYLEKVNVCARGGYGLPQGRCTVRAALQDRQIGGVGVVRVTVVRPDELGPEEARLWVKFQQASPVMSSPFFSLTFAQAVGRFRPGARVAVIEEDGRIEAFLPFELASPRFAVPIGHPMNELQGFIGSGAPVDARAVVRKAGLRGWRFLHTPAEQQSLLPHHYDGTEVPCRIVNLEGGYQSYLDSRGKQSIKRIAEKRRSLVRRVGALSLQWDSTCLEDLHKIIEWKTGRYGGAQQLFSQRAAVRIAEELGSSESNDCRGLVSVLRAGEQPVAAHLGLIGPWGLAWWFPSYDSSLSRFSPGTIMLFALAEEAANRGITRIDFGGGQDAYKFSLANDSYPVAGGAVWVSRVEKVARRLYRQLSSRPPWTRVPGRRAASA